ncbi:trans-sialidase, putative [Trypanosoma cruzi]|nr:trans-sialidase, putative [Trypanosoma cruzi]
MPCTQRGHASGRIRPLRSTFGSRTTTARFLLDRLACTMLGSWRSLAACCTRMASLRLLQGRGSGEGSAISLSRLTEELSALRSVLSTWTEKDIFFSKLSMPTAGLVAVLSDASSDDTWNDEYLCLNATVTNAAKDNDGLQLTGLESRPIWPVNTRGDKLRHVSLSHYFTLVASVTIEEAPNGNTPPLTATLADTESNHTVGLSYSHNKKWETKFEGKTTTHCSAWEPRKEYQLALMLQGNKASVDVDGESLGKEKCR